MAAAAFRSRTRQEGFMAAAAFRTRILEGGWRRCQGSVVGVLVVLLQAFAGLTHASDAKGKAVHWGYEGAGGPERWAALAPENLKCSQGMRQSPVNILDNDVIVSELEAVQFHYQPSNFRFEHNGHTLQATLEGDNHVIIRGTRFDLLQFHFHAPSEERINHRNFAMVAHLVHRSREGRLAVIAVLLEADGSNPVMDLLWAHLPFEKGEVLHPKSVLLDLAQLLPSERGYYQLTGSLTTPPCTEGVLWTVFQQPVKIRADQARIFLRLVGMNARPVQPLHQRPVRFSR